MEPDWHALGQALRGAIMAALPHQLQEARDEPIAGLALHIDAYDGCAGLYLLPASTAEELGPDRDSIGDWPISTDWDLESPHSQAFQSSWLPWERWFSANRRRLDEDDLTSDAVFRGILLAACHAIDAVERAGYLGFPKTPDFRIIVAEHDEPEELSASRFETWRRTGQIIVSQ